MLQMIKIIYLEPKLVYMPISNWQKPKIKL